LGTSWGKIVPARKGDLGHRWRAAASDDRDVEALERFDHVASLELSEGFGDPADLRRRPLCRVVVHGIPPDCNVFAPDVPCAPGAPESQR
jgi:hypothetical protein